METEDSLHVHKSPPLFCIVVQTAGRGRSCSLGVGEELANPHSRETACFDIVHTALMLKIFFYIQSWLIRD